MQITQADRDYIEQSWAEEDAGIALDRDVARYLAIVEWAKQRYQIANGDLPTFRGGNPLAFVRIERAAFRKYLS